VKSKHIVARRNPKDTLGLPDLDQAKSAVLDSLLSKESQSAYSGLLRSGFRGLPITVPVIGLACTSLPPQARQTIEKTEETTTKTN
jgi:hypothetical protein